MEFRIPTSLQLEHGELHEALARAILLPGRLGESAAKVARVLDPHFRKEEEYALPPLGLLPILLEGKVTPEMKNVVLMTDRLKADLPHMLAEHKMIVAALNDLTEAGREEGSAELEQFADKLALHARTEEEVLYPAALLIGDYISLR